MTESKRSLYQCGHARVEKDCSRIYCSTGHIIGKQGSNTVPFQSLRIGRPLEIGICQGCLDYDELGPPVPKGERGWVSLYPNIE